MEIKNDTEKKSVNQEREVKRHGSHESQSSAVGGTMKRCRALVVFIELVVVCALTRYKERVHSNGQIFLHSELGGRIR